MKIIKTLPEFSPEYMDHALLAAAARMLTGELDLAFNANISLPAHEFSRRQEEAAFANACARCLGPRSILEAAA